MAGMRSYFQRMALILAADGRHTLGRRRHIEGRIEEVCALILPADGRHTLGRWRHVEGRIEELLDLGLVYRPVTCLGFGVWG
jgi:hypothetical protein